MTQKRDNKTGAIIFKSNKKENSFVSFKRELKNLKSDIKDMKNTMNEIKEMLKWH